jgi:hypothetical protein
MMTNSYLFLSPQNLITIYSRKINGPLLRMTEI